MKNVHILPTDKPSRLSILNSGKLDFGAEIMSSSNSKPQHIYITSNEEIKVGDWVIEFQKNDSIGQVHFINGEYVIARNIQKKIILTTDQDLIKDGVQAIDDGFLEWFVKNPSCESVEVDSIETNPDYKSNWENRFTYKIIIPKEEAKYPIGGYAPGYYSCKCVTCDNMFTGDKRAVQCEPCAIKMTKEEPKQETLEEAAEKCFKYIDHRNTFIAGAKWQQERMYSEEEVYHILCEHTAFLFAGGKSTLTDWFEKFKKKDK